MPTLRVTCHLSVPSNVFFAFAAMFETEPMRLLLGFRKAPTAVLSAAGMLAIVALNARSCRVFRSRQSDFVAHGDYVSRQIQA